MGTTDPPEDDEQDGDDDDAVSAACPSADLDPSKRKLLENENRRKIVKAVFKQPGRAKNQYVEQLDMDRSLFDFHADRLVRKAVLFVEDGVQGRETACFIACDRYLWDRERTRVLFGREPVRHVGMYLAEHPGATVAEMADALGVSRSTIRHHLDTLEEHGLFEGERYGQSVHYFPDEELVAWMKEVGDRYPRPWSQAGGQGGPHEA